MPSSATATRVVDVADVAEAFATGIRRQAGAYLESSVRASRVAVVRAEKARRMAEIWERRARGMTDRAPMYLAEARRLRTAAETYDADAAEHADTVEAMRILVGPGR